MVETTGTIWQAPRVAALPNHLKKFVVDQDYRRYTPVDQAIWRYILRQLRRVLAERAHPIYLAGLEKTGIDGERIPRIERMNAILAELGWGAVTVDGFIPPAAFMEFQAHRVLVIAADIRQLDHVEYTPAPDIVHEAAGHAPIIADPEYAAYLQRFGEVGAKAMSSKRDFELYEAIRHLSILKEQPEARASEVAAAEAEVRERQSSLGEPSEMARLSRLHWWTVEYGLVGPQDRPRIYGAGLLSSLGESVSCLSPPVRKLPYSLEAASYSYDITKPQPQLFVSPDFGQLSEVLEQFANSMAFMVGGLFGLRQAIANEQVATAVYSSGLQVSGQFVRATGQGDQPIYLGTRGPTALAFADRQLEGHGRDYHREGFGSPVGPLAGCAWPPEELTVPELARLGIAPGQRCQLKFASGVQVEGDLRQLTRHDGKLLLLSFDNCTARLGDELLFKPEWGSYDMAVGERIASVFQGAADKDAFEQEPLLARERTAKGGSPDAERCDLYQRLSAARESQEAIDLGVTWASAQRHPEDWLLSLQVAEVARKRGERALSREIEEALSSRAEREPGLRTLIDRGLESLG